MLETRSFVFYLWGSTAFLFFASCSSISSLPKQQLAPQAKQEQKLSQKVERHLASPTKKVQKAKPKRKKKKARVSKAPQLHLKYKKRHFQRWINHFTQRDRPRFIRFLKRASKYRQTVRQVLRQHRLPEDLIFVALIESGFSTGVRSHANAVGVWQFIKGTATRYGLRVERPG